MGIKKSSGQKHIIHVWISLDLLEKLGKIISGPTQRNTFNFLIGKLIDISIAFKEPFNMNFGNNANIKQDKVFGHYD
jgi:hypothetical protein